MVRCLRSQKAKPSVKNKRVSANATTNAPRLLLPTIIPVYWMPDREFVECRIQTLLPPTPAPVEHLRHRRFSQVNADTKTAATRRNHLLATQGTDHEEPGSRRDPEERPVNQQDKEEVREKMLDKTLADSFPTSDPPSSIPDPTEDDSFAP